MEKQSNKPDGIIIQIVISVISILVGAALLFIPQVQINVLCYIFCGTLIVSGIISIVRFFVSAGYKELHNYRFAAGVLLCLLGCSGLLRAEDLVGNMITYMGFITMALGVIILQGMIQLKAMNRPLWVVELIFAILSLCASLIVLGNITFITDRIDHFAYWCLMIVGVLSLISLFMVWIGIKQNDRKANASSDS